MKKTILLFALIACAVPSTMLQAMRVKGPMPQINLGHFPPAPDPHSIKYLGVYPQAAAIYQGGVPIAEVRFDDPQLMPSLEVLTRHLRPQFPHADEMILLYPMGIQIEGISLAAHRTIYKK